MASVGRDEVPPIWLEQTLHSFELLTCLNFDLTVIHLSNGAESPDVKKANSNLDLECLEPKSPEGTARVKIASPFDIVPDQDDVVIENDVKTSCTRCQNLSAQFLGKPLKVTFIAPGEGSAALWSGSREFRQSGYCCTVCTRLAAQYRG